ncbi:LysR family transcriptional regulator [Aquabacter spiritensis]|uniref:DNA-binding transcriptional LysR family regulator n=1 Tax=Aquabacter spiritensis TaxID=933073 RepID=A0A4R3M1T6_9HYPH|nr:LysR family transcriptional regulator [Aquabacter spiritensis]TCT06149.1 DNA-binding transcriptional LysR family regulator [Aquabacter spiritensis]
MRPSFVPAALRYVDQVARSGSIQQASRELRVAASAIDRQILLLEQDLGVPLFERRPRGMQLTASGEAILGLIRRWRIDERRAIAEIRRLQGVQQGHVQLFAMDSHTTSFLPRLVDRLAQAHPLVSLDIEIGSPDEAPAALLAGRADVAVAFNLPPRRDLQVLWREDLPIGCVVAPSHPLAGARSVSMQEICAHPVALQSKALAIRRFLEAQYSWLLAGAKGQVESNSLQLVKLLACSGRYAVVTSELDAAPELISGALVFVPVRDTGAEPQTISIAVEAKGVDSVVRLVAQHLTEAVAACLAEVRAARDPAPAPG